MSARVDVKPELLRWAWERSRIQDAVLRDRFPRLEEWARGEKQPTFRQLEDFARTTHVPLGYLFLPEPPRESLPIPDFRTVANKAPERPSPNLLDTIYAMQRRQAWLREERIESEASTLEIVGSARLTDDPAAIGQEMRRSIGIDGGWAAQVASWEQAVSELRRRIEALGVMAVINGRATHGLVLLPSRRGLSVQGRVRLLRLRSRQAGAQQLEVKDRGTAGSQRSSSLGELSLRDDAIACV